MQNVFPAMNKEMLKKKPFILEDYHHVCRGYGTQDGRTATPLTTIHEVDERRFLPYVTSGYSEQLHSALIHVVGRIFNRDFYIPHAYNMLAHPGQELQIWRPFRRPSTARYVGRQGSRAVSIDLFHLNKCDATYVQLKE
jgi:hypothetical protein